MNENLSVELAPVELSDYAQLSEKSDACSPAKVLDMEIDVLSGDTILTPAAVAAFDDSTISELIDAWQVYVDNENVTSTEKAKAAVACKRISSLKLVQLMVSQIKGDVDNSETIGLYEAEAYDHYSDGLYRSALRQKVEQLEAFTIHEPSVEFAKADLLDELETLVDKAQLFEALESPENETLQAVQTWIHSRFGAAFELVDSVGSQTLTGEDIVGVINQAIEVEPALQKTGWKAESVTRNKSAVAVRVAEKKVLVPTQRSVSINTMYKLLVHEAYGHALRSANAELNGNEVGRYGTATYSTFEESFEVALEQCALGTYDSTRGINHYIAVGLSVSDGKSSQEVSRIFESMHQLKKASKTLDDEAVNAARRLTGTQLQRTFAGMTDVDNGIAHRKSIDYLHGLNGTWKLLNYLVKTDSLDTGMNWLLSAKFNPYDAGDRELTNEFHPMPEALIPFFEAEGESVHG